MSDHPGQLPIPPGSFGAGEAREVLRAWAVDGGLQVSIKPSFDDPGIWGLLLIDLARHAARAYAAEVHREEAVLVAIRTMFDAEWERPTDLGVTAPVQ